MKIKIHSKSRGTIISAELPLEDGAQNIAEGGPMLTRGLKIDELDLPTIASDAELSKLLKNSSIKRGKTSVSLSPSQQKDAKACAPRKKRR